MKRISFSIPGFTIFLSAELRIAVFLILTYLIRIRIQHFRLNTDPDPVFYAEYGSGYHPDPDPIRIQSGSGSYPVPGHPKIGKNLLLKKNYNFFYIENYNLPIPGPP
jgi:hypothetical protein